MATSESDDFESADEEMNHDIPTKRTTQRWCSPSVIDSESDDDTEYVPRTPYTNMIYNRNVKKYSSKTSIMTGEEKFHDDTVKENKDISIKGTRNHEKTEQVFTNTEESSEKSNEKVTLINLEKVDCVQADMRPVDVNLEKCDTEVNLKKDETDIPFKSNVDTTTITPESNEKEKDCNQQQLDVKQSEIKSMESYNPTSGTNNIAENINKTDKLIKEEQILSKESLITDELTELEMPEEMKSNKKFKEVFKPEGWEGLGNEIELLEELTEEKLQPILKRLSVSAQETQNSSMGWGWGSWGVSSLINTATAGVSTLSNHVSHGLMLLEESMTASEDSKLTKMEGEENVINDSKTEQSEEYSSFGFGNLISGVSSITKLVESTGSKVMTGGLDTLEAIGKKTMEVLQEGDPGLKKKRAFFVNEMTEKPILSQVLREAKEKADAIEKTIEEKQQIRKVHFESLFDDYQGLVHLEALEMLSKQSNIKIQQHLIGLDTTELNSVQETLDEVKELCDLGEDDEKETVVSDEDLKIRLQEACKDLGINVTYEKLYSIYEDSKMYFTSSETHNDQEIFEHAISVLAQFTAFSVERFHKTAEMLLIKEHRSTVNEADALVHLTHILSNQVGILANTYCSALDTFSKISDKPDKIKNNITTIFMEASNASSYIQDAFKLLIPIIKVGAI